MIYFSIDVEASGPLAPLYNLLSIGATVVSRDGDHHVLGVLTKMDFVDFLTREATLHSASISSLKPV